MNILHYSLGLPPYRSGGLTKYSLDLINSQIKRGHNVSLLFPGRILTLNKNVKIKKYSSKSLLQVFEIINPLPIPLLNGVLEPQRFTEKCDKRAFEVFFSENKIDIIHVHTLMGLYKELLEVAKDKKIKIVYTTHDYYGLCTKVNFVNSEGKLCEERNIENCLECNKTGYNNRAIKILQSPMYRFLKKQGVILKLKPKLQKLKYKSKSIERKNSLTEIEIDKEEYINLLDYYKRIFELIDEFIYNSTVSKEVYSKYINKKGKIIPITHADIKDKRIYKNYSKDKLRITYLGPDKEYKGFNLLVDAFKIIYKRYGEKVELNIYGNVIPQKYKDGITLYGKYNYNDLEAIFRNTDLLIVPSIWKETFGFITLEALSHGVPVIVTENVGSKDIIEDCGIISSTNLNKLVEIISEIVENREILKIMNKNILKRDFCYDMNIHSKDIEDIYSYLISRKNKF